ncbi:hypothetical protein JYU20_04195 [Bacteroidales bacterium AH-315-I05]|nr:hypothetical protein [Bacteroidales bacterium AH-315-I05]
MMKNRHFILTIFIIGTLAHQLIGTSAFAQTGPNSPATVVADNTIGSAIWISPANAVASDNFYASSTAMGQPTFYLKATDYGFSIPACDVINGIEVKVEWSASQPNKIKDNVVNLVIGGIIQTGVNKATGTFYLPTTEGIKIYGGPTDTWGKSLTPADINNTGFGTAISVLHPGGPPVTANVDHITIIVYHTAQTAMTYSSSTVIQVTGNVNPNTINNQIIRVDVTTAGVCPVIDATSFTFNLNGTTVLSDVANAKLFFTGTNPVFSTNTQLGATVSSIPSGSFTIDGFTQPLLGPTDYFWLAVDVVAGATISNFVDAECTSLIVDAVSRTPTTTAPTGNRPIVAPVVYTVGSSGFDYTTIQLAYDGVPTSLSNNYFIELQANYNDALETPPITFNQKIMNSYTITIRPAAGVTGTEVALDPGSGIDLWTFDGADNVILDGRPGGTGTGRQLTIRNTRTITTIGNVITLINDATNNRLTYLNLEGEPVVTSALVEFGYSTGATGNDDNTVSFCHFKDISVAGTTEMPANGISSQGTTGRANSGNTIDNCHFIDIFNTGTGVTASISLNTNSDSWTITNNHFYQTTTYLNQGSSFGFITIYGGGGYLIDGNFLGGSGPNAAASVMLITNGQTDFNGIWFNSGVSGNPIIITNNTVANIDFTSSYSTSAIPLLKCIELNGSADFIVGSLGNGNTIGSTSLATSITLTNNAGSTSVGFMAIRNLSTGKVSIAYNKIGGMKLAGIRDGATSYLVKSNAGIVTVDNNTIGNAVANNILVSSNSTLSGIMNSSINGITVTNNTLQNWDHDATTAPAAVDGIYNTAGSLICTGNTIKIISTASDDLHGLVNHQGDAGTIINNTIQDITLSNTGATTQFIGIYYSSASNGTVSNNTIGSPANDNITIAGDAGSFGIWKDNTGTLTCDSNMIQEFNMTGTAGAAYFVGFGGDNGVILATADTVRNIDVASPINLAEAAYGVFFGGTAAAGQLVTKCAFQNINAITVGATDTRVVGAYLSVGSGSFTKNYISGLTNRATGAGTDNFGIQLTSGGWDVFNNVVIIDNFTYLNSLAIVGIADDASGGTNRFYHNTVKVDGYTSGSVSFTGTFIKTGASISEVKNNIFQNVRTGGTAGHYVIVDDNLGTLNNDFNYLEVLDDANKLGMWGGADQTLANWTGNTGATNSITGSEIIDIDGYATGTNVADAGTNLLATVSQDKNDVNRDAAPWIGAYETNGIPKYYWVTLGGGNWPVSANWSTGSGGSPNLSQPPAKKNDVYFDLNSFTGPGQLVTVPTGTWYCKSINFLDITKTPVMTGPGILIIGQ